MNEISSLPLQLKSERLLWHVEQFLRATNTSEETFAVSLIERLRQVPDSMRVDADFPMHGPIHKLMQSGGQKLRRWIKRDGRPSIDMFDPIVTCLSGPFRNALERDDAAARGRLSFPQIEGHGSSVCTGQLARTTGELMIEIGEALRGDHVIDERDPPELLARIEAKCLEGQASMQAVIALVRAAQEKQREARPLLVVSR